MVATAYHIINQAHHSQPLDCWNGVPCHAVNIVKLVDTIKQIIII